MKVQQKNDNLILKDIKDFNIEHILECGQCFNFEKVAAMDYIIVAYGKMLHIVQDGEMVILHDTSLEDYEKIWKHYFDIDTDYGKIKKFLKENDEKIVPAIEDKWGIRILNQEFFEMLLSFIISQNKQIPHIKQIVRGISEKYGKEIGEYNGRKYYSFPSLEAFDGVTEEDFRALKTGFRAPYLMDAINQSRNGLCAENFVNLVYDDAVKEMLKIKGVGEKVANCVALFSLGYRNAFPVDVWVKRVMEETYFGKETSKEEIMKFAKNKFGEYGGYAQQYHFYYMRDKNVKKV